MQKKVSQKVAEVKILAQMAVGLGNGDKTWSRSITNLWSDLLRSLYYKESEHRDLEKDMIVEYKKFSHLRPKMEIQKDGSLKVTGLPKH